MKAVLIKSNLGEIKAVTPGRVADLLKQARSVQASKDFGKGCDLIEVWTRGGGVEKRVSLQNIKAKESINK
jgi:hypothetical protein